MYDDGWRTAVDRERDASRVCVTSLYASACAEHDDHRARRHASSVRPVLRVYTARTSRRTRGWCSPSGLSRPPRTDHSVVPAARNHASTSQSSASARSSLDSGVNGAVAVLLFFRQQATPRWLVLASICQCHADWRLFCLRYEQQRVAPVWRLSRRQHDVHRRLTSRATSSAPHESAPAAL